MQLYQDSLYQDDQSIGNGMSLIDPNLTAASDSGYSLTQSFAPQTNTVAPSVEQPTTADKVGNAIGQISEVGSGMNNAVNMFKNFSNNTNAITGGASIFKQAANTEGLAKAIQASVSPTKDGAAAASAGGVALGSGVSSAANIGAGIGGAAASMLAEAVNMRKAYGNDRGVSSRAEKRMSAAGKGMDAAMMGTSFIPGVGGFISLGIGAAKLGMMGISALVDRIKEKREGPLRPDFNPIMKNVMTPNWVPTAAYGLPLAKFGLPLMHQPTVEAEDGETVLMNTEDGGAHVMPISGKSHAQGGEVKNFGPDGKYIFSKSLGFDKAGQITIKEKDIDVSFAKAASNIEKKFTKKRDDISQNTKQFELDSLTAKAEQAREIKEQLGQLKKVKQQIMKYGGYLPKAADGYDISGGSNAAQNNIWSFDQPTYLSWIKQQPEYVNKSVYDLGSQEAKDLYRTRYAEELYNTHGPSAVTQFNLNKPLERGAYDRLTKPLPTSGLGRLGVEVNEGIKTPQAFDPTKQRYNPNLVGPFDRRIPFREEQVNRVSPIGREVLNTDPAAEKNTLLTPGDKMSLASMAPATLFNSIMAMRKPEVEKFNENNYANDALALASRRFDDRALQAKLIGDFAGAKDSIGQMKGLGAGVTLANMQGLHNNLFANRQQLEGEKQKINLGLDQQQAQAMMQLGEANRGERIRVSDINAKNKAARQAFGAEAVNNIGQTLATTGQGMNAGALNKIGLKMLSGRSTDFDMKNLYQILNDPANAELIKASPELQAFMVSMTGLQPNQGYTTSARAAYGTKPKTDK